MDKLNDDFTSSDELAGLNGAVDGETVSAGEAGNAVADDSARDVGLEEVIVGEIPDAADITRMLWTARCTNPAHGLLGTFGSQEQAEQAKAQHLVSPFES